MQQNRKDIELLSYHASKIGNSHIILENKVPLDINVLEGIPIYCKLSLQGKLPPLVLNIEYIKKGSLNVFASYFKHEPDAFEDCDYKGHKPSKIVIKGDKEKFKSNWYYLTFSAPLGLNINVTANLGSNAEGNNQNVDRRKAARELVKSF